MFSKNDCQPEGMVPPCRFGYIDQSNGCSQGHYRATVLHDSTVRLQGQIIDIPPGRRGRGYQQVRKNLCNYSTVSGGFTGKTI